LLISDCRFPDFQFPISNCRLKAAALPATPIGNWQLAIGNNKGGLKAALAEC